LIWKGISRTEERSLLRILEITLAPLSPSLMLRDHKSPRSISGKILRRRHLQPSGYGSPGVKRLHHWKV
jgi:hypothetical protein